MMAIELKKPISISKEQALDEGYVYCGFVGRDYQTLMKIADITDLDFRYGSIVLADKNPMRPLANAKSIREIIADSMESDWGSETGDDTEVVYKAIIKLDFTATEKMINEALKNIASYPLTNIYLRAEDASVDPNR